MRITFSVLLVLSICGWDRAYASGPIRIWQWGFVTMEGDDPVAASGASLFKPNGEGLEGPLNRQTGDSYHLKFSVSDKVLSAVLSSPTGSKVTLEGSVVEVRGEGGKSCSLIAKANNGPTYVLLQTYQDHCSI